MKKQEKSNTKKTEWDQPINKTSGLSIISEQINTIYLKKSDILI